MNLDQSPIQTGSTGQLCPSDSFIAPHRHIQWSVGEIPYANPVDSGSLKFHYNVYLGTATNSLSFREEVKQACLRLNQIRGDKRIALCYSGGIDSEVIALTLFELGIPFDLYFLDIWGVNAPSITEASLLFLQKIQKKVHHIRLEREYFIEEYAPRIFQKFGVELPTYLALTYLFEKIPTNQFLVVGDGDFDKTGSIFKKIQTEHQENSSLDYPVSTGSIFYYLWSQKNRRPGEFYFYSSSQGLISSILRHQNKLPGQLLDTRNIILEQFPEIPARAKTTNWDGAAKKENLFIRNWLRRQSYIFSGFEFWKPSAGTMAKVHLEEPVQRNIFTDPFAKLPTKSESAHSVETTSNSLTLCALPWSHVLFDQGKVSPCCNFKQEITDQGQKLDSKLLDLPLIKSLREQMLAGEKPAGCASCFANEKSTGKSMRTHFNEKFPRVWKTKPKLRYLEFNLGNLCNLKCRGCNSANSSKWIADEIALGKKELNSASSIIRPNISALEEILPEIEYLKLLGGEPFLIPEHEAILEMIHKKNFSKNIFLDYATNGTVRVSESVLSLWKEFKGVKLFFSIDGKKENNDFFRDGSDWEKIIENIRWYQRQLNPAKTEFGFHTVVNVYNVHELFEIDEWLMSEFPEFHFTKDILDRPDWLAIDNLPKSEKVRLEKEYLDRSMISGLRETVANDYRRVSHHLANRLGGSFSNFAESHQKLNSIRISRETPRHLKNLLSFE